MGTWQEKIDGILYSKNETLSVWSDVRVAALSTRSSGSKQPTPTSTLTNGSGSQGVLNLAFSPTQEQEVYFEVQIPHNYKEGTDLHPHVHWFGRTNGAAGTDVSWGLEYSVAKLGNVYPNTTIIYGDTNIFSEDIVADKHYLTELGTIDMTGNGISTMLVCRLFRDATGIGGTDDYAYDAMLLEFDIHYEIDSLGSQLQYSKEA